MTVYNISASLSIFLLLISATTPASVPCPEKSEAMELFHINSVEKFDRLLKVLEEVHRISNKVKDVKLPGNSTQGFWEYFLDDAENSSTLAG